MLHGAKTLRLRIHCFHFPRIRKVNGSSHLRQQFATAMAATNGAIGAANPKTDKTLKLENVSK